MNSQQFFLKVGKLLDYRMIFTYNIVNKFAQKGSFCYGKGI